MQWVRKPGFEAPEESRPRNLTDEERDSILDRIPSVYGVSKEARDAANKSIRHKADIFLRRIQLTPYALPELISDMIRKFEKSRVTPETAVGIATAEAIGRIATQSTLNTFHVSGSAKNQSRGLDGMKELINATKNRKNPSCTINFKDKNMSYMQTLRKRREIVGITVGRLMKDYEIDEPKNLRQFSWHKTYPIITGKKIPNSQFVMRIYLDVNLMFQFHVTMERICNVIEERNPGLSYIHSPLPFAYDDHRLAIIDIYPHDNIISEVLTKKKISTIDRPSLIFLKSVFLPTFESLIVQGIPGITSTFVVEAKVLRIIRDEIRAYPNDSPELLAASPEVQQRMKNIWHLLFNKLQMRLTGIGRQNLERLFDVMGITVYDWQESHVTVEIPQVQTFELPGMLEDSLRKMFNGPDFLFQKWENGIVTLLINNVSPLAYIKKITSVAEQAEVDRYDQNKKKGIYIVPKEDPIITATSYYYLDTSGSNLKELLAREDVDPVHTYSNDFHETTRVLGVDAAKCYYIREFLDQMEGNVDPRHIRLIGDFVFNQGRPLGLTFAGISRQPIGYLDLASFQKSVDTFARAALYGRSEKIIGTSASIYVGKRIGIGTGALGLNVDFQKAYIYGLMKGQVTLEELQKKYGDNIDFKKLYEEELLKRSTLDAVIVENAVEELDEETFGNEDLQFTGEYDEGLNNLQELGTLQTNALPESKVRVKAKVSGVEDQTLPTTNEGLINKASTISPELFEVLKMLSTAPAYPNAATTRLHVSPLRRGLVPTGNLPPEVPRERKDISEVTLPRFTFIETAVKEEITESLPSPVVIKDEDI